MSTSSALSFQVCGPLPPWAQRLLKRPLVEVRRGISLDHDPPHEDCSVLVLTAPSGRYVDVRFRLSPDQESAVGKDSEGFAGYATAGISFANILPGTKSCVPYECTIYVKWEHPIDSSGAFSTDGADMFLLANGDTMEIGIMGINGKMRMFKEYWTEPRDVDISSYTVMELKSDGKDVSARGMAIVIGRYCQGILQTLDRVWVERWVAEDDCWTRDARNTSPRSIEYLPCQWMTKQPRKLGDTVNTKFGVWEVVEVSED